MTPNQQIDEEFLRVCREFKIHPRTKLAQLKQNWMAAVSQEAVAEVILQYYRLRPPKKPGRKR